LVDAAIQRLTRQGYLDDDAFARAWVASRDRARPRGERALRAELLLKGVERPVIDAVLVERGGIAEPDAPRSGSADEQAAHRLLEKQRRSLERELDPRRRRQRVYALLARNGFDPETCRRLAATFADADADSGDAEPTDDDEG
jgi:regulatory protein